METDTTERRREPRFPVDAEAVVGLPNSHEFVSATATNLSGAGALLRFAKPVQLAVGDWVVCDFKIRDDPDVPLPYWGAGRVVRADGWSAAIELSAGGLHPLDPNGGDHRGSIPADSSEAGGS